ncbi:alpha/beta fold hydrolase [Deinococcus misasensis]|uniref:alpha/beta fold hydrolase n=1 Tax=Deinococcus misasensis TaxID=392413 RepID=UPI000558F1EB|nr:alpha/beta fold hydrolase [Deinococcus misasensis]
MKKIVKYGVLTLPLMALASCATTQMPDPLQSYKNQKLTWYQCDTSVVPYADLDESGRAECADVKVPLDYHNPALGNGTVAVMRYKAGKPAERKGAIFFNPGGPGGDGHYLGALFGFLWSNGNPNTTMGAKLKQLSDEYDLVGFSPRGTGSSFRTACGTNELLGFTAYPSEDRSPENLASMQRNAKIIANACSKTPTNAYINTDNTARDMDLIRGLMKDQKLNYIGYSYGTWLGAWYTKLFPERAGKILLDSNMALDKSMDDAFGMQPMSFERHFRDVVLGYAARHNDVYGLGTTKEEAYAKYKALPASLKNALNNTGMINNMYYAEGIVRIPVGLVAALGVHDIIKQGKDGFEVLDAIASYPFFKNPEMNNMAISNAYDLAFSHLNYASRAPSTAELGSSQAVFAAVMCGDTPSIYNSYQQYVDVSNQEAKDYPLLGGDATAFCYFYGHPRANKPATPSAQKMPPIMMLQSEYDPPTAREGALSGFKSLPNAHMVFVDNDATHGLFPYGTECVDLPVLNYFLHGTLPAKNFSVCEAKPLPALKAFWGTEELVPAELSAFEVGQNYDQNSPVPSQVSKQGLPYSLNVYKDPAVAEKVLVEIRKILHNNALPVGQQMFRNKKQ